MDVVGAIVVWRAAMRLYLAHPLSGHDYDGIMTYYRDLSRRLPYYDILCPMVAKERLKGMTLSDGHKQFPVTTPHAIVERDRWMVSQADVVLVDLTPANSDSGVSIGCVSELAWAALLGKHTVLVMEDGNVHDHSFVRENADVIFPALEEAEGYLTRLAKGILNEDRPALGTPSWKETSGW